MLDATELIHEYANQLGIAGHRVWPLFEGIQDPELQRLAQNLPETILSSRATPIYTPTRKSTMKHIWGPLNAVRLGPPNTILMCSPFRVHN